MTPFTISNINQLSAEEKREIYIRLIPNELFENFTLPQQLIDSHGNDLLKLKCPAGSPSVEMELRHEYSFKDPLLYGHITETLTGRIHILLYILNDPSSPRFDVDRLANGTKTMFGILHRNLLAEEAAMNYGLAPGQIRKGLRLLGVAISRFEHFVKSLGHDLYLTEPLYYHNAYIFERYGFTYQNGRSLMERIQSGFEPGGYLIGKLDNSTAFRNLQSTNSIRLRSWAIHDGILGEPFQNVTMYKYVGKQAQVNTSLDCPW